MTDLIISLAIFVTVLALMLLLRLKLIKNFEVRQSDILIALIPIVLWLLFTGKIEKLEFGDLKIQTAFLEASEAPITKQIISLKLPVEKIRMNPKGRADEIPGLIQNQTEGLVFTLGYGYYFGPTIKQYLKRLTLFPFFKYIIINDRDGKFFGMINARDLESLFSLSEHNFTSNDFADWVNNSDTKLLSKIPFLIPSKYAIKKETNKQSALETMEKLNIEVLPVVNKEGMFTGIVDRSRLTASLIIDVAKKVK